MSPIGRRTVIALVLCLLTGLAAQAGQERGSKSFQMDGFAVKVKKGSENLHPNGTLESAELTEATQVRGIWLSGGPHRTQFFTSGKLRSGTLARAGDVAGFRLQKDTVFEIFSKGNLRSGTLSRATEISGANLPAGTLIFFNSKGKPLQAYPPAGSRIHGLRVGGDAELNNEVQFFHKGPTLSATAAERQTIQGLAIPAGSRVYFYRSGRIYAVAPSEPIVFRGLKFRGEISLDERGRLREGWLAQAQKISGVWYSPQRQPVQFQPTGQVFQGLLHGKQRVEGILLQDQTMVHWHSNGKLAHAFLAEASKIDGIQFCASRSGAWTAKSLERDTPAGLYWYPSGKIKSGLLAKAQKIGQVMFQGLSPASPDAKLSVAGKDDLRLYFHSNGRVESGHLARDQMVQEIPLKSCTELNSRCRVHFHPNGKLKSGQLAQATELHGVRYMAASVFKLHSNGRVAFGKLAADQKIGQLNIPRGVVIALDRRGRLRSAPIDSPWTMGPMQLPRGSLLFRDSEERVGAARLGSTIKMGGISLKPGSWLILDRGERIASFQISGPLTIGDNEFPAQTFFHLDHDGTLVKATLSQDSRIQQLPISAAEPLELYPKGRIKSCRLSRAIELGGVSHGPKQRLKLYADGTPFRAALAQSEKVGPIEFSKGDQIIDVHRSGSPRAVRLSSDRDYAGVPCRSDTMVYFYPDGSLRECWLRGPHTQGHTVVRNRVVLFPDGTLKHTYLDRETTISGLVFAADEIAFLPSGKVKSGRLARQQRIGRALCPALSRITLDDSGALLTLEEYAPPPPLDP